MKRIVITLIILLLLPASTHSDVSEWVLGEPTLASDDYEWVLGGPFVEVDNTAAPAAGKPQVITINMF